MDNGLNNDATRIREVLERAGNQKLNYEARTSAYMGVNP